ncbi:hypothetical protein HDU87_008467 [Geranomyces variabilis]|uniref:Uncharacterized protein n=1 Tax=Geranomyces variabilis TaxID=109894 RepID=A0AAD5TNR1_9FUNG|nr:hypothetical protein HDU87_008467 [Geranomyces variabilis]
MPGLSNQPSLQTRVLSYDLVSHADTTCLLAPRISLTTTTAGSTTGTVANAAAAHDLATESRCLLITAPKGTRKCSKGPRSLALDCLLADPTIRRTGCKLTKDALLLRSNFGHDLRQGVDLTHLYCLSGLDASKRFITKELFTLFSEIRMGLVQDRNARSWQGCAAKVLDFTTADPKVLTILMEHNTSALAVEDMQQKKYDSKFSTATRRKDGSYNIVNTQFRNRLMRKPRIGRTRQAKAEDRRLFLRAVAAETAKSDLPLPLSLLPLTACHISNKNVYRGAEKVTASAMILVPRILLSASNA